MIRRFDVKSGTETLSMIELMGEERWDPIRSLAFSPGGSMIVAVRVDSPPMMIDSRLGLALIGLHDNTERVTSVAFSPDGDRIASRSRFGTIMVLGIRDRERETGDEHRRKPDRFGEPGVN